LLLQERSVHVSEVDPTAGRARKEIPNNPQVVAAPDAQITRHAHVCQRLGEVANQVPTVLFRDIDETKPS
jgi:hypothetical protein